MKSAVKAFARRMGFVVATRHHAGARYLESPPRGVFDEVLLRLFPRLDGLRFIQIGANDGVRADPIRHHVLRHAWTGVLVEPLPVWFRALQQNYAAARGLTFLNAAVDAHRGTRTIHFVAPETANVPDWFHGLASFDLEHVRRATGEARLPASALASAEVPTITWTDVRAALRGVHCDVLVMDTEGMDIPLLRLANLATWRPAAILFEHACASRAEQLAFYAELLDNGYEIATAGADTVAHLVGGSDRSVAG